MFEKFKNKNKKYFVSKGMYFVAKGEYKGSYILNISECDAVDSKTFMQFPDKETISMTDEEIKERFNDGYFEYVRSVPSKIYAVCVAEFKYMRKS